MLQEDISPDKSCAKRSQTTGKLVVTLPKAKELLRKKPVAPKPPNSTPPPAATAADASTNSTGNGTPSADSRPFLEVDPSVSKGADIANIVPRGEQPVKAQPGSRMGSGTAAPGGGLVKELGGSEVFVDDEEVPPLI